MDTNMDTNPKDKFHIIYFVVFIFSSTISLQWRNAISGMDYFQYLYPDLKPEIVIPIALNVASLFSVVFIVTIVHIVSIYKRFAFGSVVFFISLLSIPLMDIWIHNCTLNLNLAYGITVVMMVFLSIAFGVQQSSIFGLSGMLPPHYTQAASAGSSASGVISIACRIVTKASFKEERVGAIAFFVLALLMVGIGVICTLVLRFSKFIKYHVEKAKTSDTTKSENVNQETTNDIEMDSLISMDNSDEFEIDGISEEHEIIKPETNNETQLYCLRFWKAIKNMWKVIISLFFIYVTTYMIYPSLLSEVQYCDIGDWTPVVLFSVYCVMDFTGRLLTLLPYKMSPNWLFVASLSRLFLIPLIIICISPSPTDPLVSSGASLWLAISISLCVGFTHGYFGTTGLIIGPTLVEPHSKELAGTMSIFDLFLAQSVASGLAYAVNPLTTIDVNIPCVENYTATFNCLLNGNYSEF